MPSRGGSGVARATTAAAGGLLVVGLVGACGAGGGGSPAPPTKHGTTTSARATTTATPRTTSATLTAQVGASLTLTGGSDGQRLAATVVQFLQPAPAAPGAAPATDIVLAAQMHLESTGTRDVQVDPQTMFRLVDDQGRTYKSSATVSTSAGMGLPSSLTLVSGRASDGYVTFVVPAAAGIVGLELKLSAHGSLGRWAIQGGPASASPSVSGPSAVPTAGSPAAVVQAYVNAINAGDYATAWNLGGKNFGASYTDFVAGFDHTIYDDLTVTGTDGSTVSVTLAAAQDDGSVQTYQGTYTVEGGVITGASLHRA